VTTEVRMIKYLEEAMEFVKISVLSNKEVTISKMSDGYMVKTKGI